MRCASAAVNNRRTTSSSASSFQRAVGAYIAADKRSGIGRLMRAQRRRATHDGGVT